MVIYGLIILNDIIYGFEKEDIFCFPAWWCRLDSEVLGLRI